MLVNCEVHYILNWFQQMLPNSFEIINKDKQRKYIFPKFQILGQDEREYKLVGNKAKGRISKQVLQENKTRQIFHFRKKCPFFGKFGLLSFLVTPVFRFAYLPHSRRTLQVKFLIHKMNGDFH